MVPNTVRLVAKIEKAAALTDLPAIVDAADAIMVARGDLGVELPFEEVPLVQKRVIIAAMGVGLAEACMASAVEHANTREAFEGRLKADSKNSRR